MVDCAAKVVIVNRKITNNHNTLQHTFQETRTKQRRNKNKRPK